MAGKVGGWRGHPNSLAALAASRRSWGMQRSCEQCGSPALRDDRFCPVHSRRARKLPPVTPGQAAGRVLQGMHRAGLLPDELISLPVWRALSVQATSVRAPLRLRMVLAWEARQRQPLVWAALVREAQVIGSRQVKRFAVWPMLEVA